MLCNIVISHRETIHCFLKLGFFRLANNNRGHVSLCDPSALAQQSDETLSLLVFHFGMLVCFQAKYAKTNLFHHYYISGTNNISVFISFNQFLPKRFNHFFRCTCSIAENSFKYSMPFAKTPVPSITSFKLIYIHVI